MRKKQGVQFTEKDMTRMSIILAAFFSVGYVNYMIGTLFETGGMIVNIVILAVLMVFSYKTIVKIQLSGLAVTFLILVTAYYLITRQVVTTTLFGKEFLFYFCFSAVLGMYKCDTEKFLRYTSYMTLLIIPFYVDIFVEMNSTKYNNSIEMGLAYSILQILLTTVFHFLFYRKESGKLMKVIYCLAAFFLFDLVLKGNRGIVVTLLCSFGFCFIRGIEKKREVISSLRLIVVVVLVAVMALYFYEILEWLQKVLESWNLEANFIEKFLSLQKEGDVSNGRDYIFDYTVEHISEDLFLGHGLSSILYNSGYRIVYPHNFFLQIMYDGGFLLTVPVLLILGFGFVRTFKMTNKAEAVFMLFLMSVSLPRLMVSGDIWKNGYFWLLIMHTMKFHIGKTKKEGKDYDEIPSSETSDASVDKVGSGQSVNGKALSIK